MRFGAALLMAVVPTVVIASVGGGDISYEPKGVGKVVFQHQYHVSLKGQQCENCHEKTFQKQGGESLYEMDMGTLTKGRFCGLCHNGTRAFDVKDEKSCKRCHRD